MRGERQLLRLGEYLVRRACRQLPQDVREERYQEWAAELPAILHDPPGPVRPAACGADARLCGGYAAGHGDDARHRISRLGATLAAPLPVAGLVVALSVWAVVQAPGDGLNYLRLVWGLLLWPISFASVSAPPGA